MSDQSRGDKKNERQKNQLCLAVHIFGARIRLRQSRLSGVQQQKDNKRQMIPRVISVSNSPL